MVLVIIAGHIDLSVGSVAAFVGICVAIAMRDWGLSWWVGILLGLALGALVGAWQGLWTAYVGIPAFIVTLSGMLLFRGANQYVGKSNSVPVSDDFQVIGGGYLPEIGPNTGYNNLTVLSACCSPSASSVGACAAVARSVKLGAEVEEAWDHVGAARADLRRHRRRDLLFGSGRPGTSFPISGIILAVLVLLYGFISNRTVIGRHIYAVGGNRHAAELSGVKSKKVNFLVMMNMSILAALAGMIFVARSTASGPSDGVGWELDAIAAVFIGGAAVTGGVGTVVGSIVGGLVMAVLNNGLQLQGVGADVTQMIKGLVLLVAVALRRLEQVAGTCVAHRHDDEELPTRLRRRDSSARPTDQAAPRRSVSRTDCRTSDLPGPPETPRIKPPPRPGQGAARDQEGSAFRPDAMRGREHMRTFTKVLGVTAVAALVLTGCGRSSDTGTTPGRQRERFRRSGRVPQGRRHRRRAAAEDLGELGAGGAAVQRRPHRRRLQGRRAVRQRWRVRAAEPDHAPWSPRARRSSSSVPSTARSWAPSSSSRQGRRRHRHRLRPSADEHPGRGLLRGLRQLQGRRAAGPGAAGRHGKAKKPNGPYNIELFAGSPDDANAKVFFDGAMSVLKPKIDDGTLKVVSGQNDFEQAVTQGWKAENAQKRMDTLLSAATTAAPRSTASCPRTTPWPARS